MIHLVLLLFLFCLGGCQKSTLNETQTVRLNLSEEPNSLDPRKARALTAITLIHMIFEGLTRSSKEGGVELALAEKVDVSEDGLRYVFHLRNSLWSNGEPLLAEDFAKSWRETLNPQFPSDIAYHLFVIKNGRKAKKGEISLEQLGIETPDPKTLIVELETPTPYFLELVSTTPFFPIFRKAEGSHWDLEAKTLISNGPFVLKEWKKSDCLMFEKNQFYWEASQVSLKQIECCLASSDTGIRMFQEGKLDWTGSPLATISSDAIYALREQGILKVKPFSGTAFFRVNTLNGPLSNASFRQALAIAIDRKAIADSLLKGGHQKATSLVPKEMGLSKEGYFEDGNATRAFVLLQKALEEMGIKKGELLPIRLSFVNIDRNGMLVQTIQKQWEQVLGIQVELEAVEPKILSQRVSRKEFQVALGSWTADFNDPINFLEVFKYKDSGTNNTGWENQRYVELLTRSSVCRKFEERIECLACAERVLMDQMPIIPIYHYVLNFLVNEDLKDVALSPIGNLDFRWAYWEKASSGF